MKIKLPLPGFRTNINFNQKRTAQFAITGPSTATIKNKFGGFRYNPLISQKRNQKDNE